MEEVTQVEASTGDHSLTVEFDDETANLEAITKALNDAGYTVGEPKKL